MGRTRKNKFALKKIAILTIQFIVKTHLFYAESSNRKSVQTNDRSLTTETKIPASSIYKGDFFRTRRTVKMYVHEPPKYMAFVRKL